MKQTVKERLNDKARKIVDLIYDEVSEMGKKSIKTSFVDNKTGVRYTLCVEIEAQDDVQTSLSQYVEDLSAEDDDF